MVSPGIMRDLLQVLMGHVRLLVEALPGSTRLTRRLLDFATAHAQKPSLRQETHRSGANELQRISRMIIDVSTAACHCH